MDNSKSIKYIADALTGRLLELKMSNPNLKPEVRMVLAIEGLLEENKRVYMGIRSLSDKPRCTECGHILAKRQICLFDGLVEALARVYKWCLNNKKHEFSMKDIRDMLNKNQYARFGDWVMFSGLIYKKGKAEYGMNMERVKAFLYEDVKIVSSLWKDPITKELTPCEWKTAKEIPGLARFLTAEGLYDPNYTQAKLGL